jgi:hypothetical protein
VKIIKTRDEEMLANIRKEFEHLKDLAHENVIKVHELLVDATAGEVFLVMELFRGKELFVLLSEIGHYNGELNRGDRQAPLHAAARGHPLPAPLRRGAPRPQAQQHPGLRR